MATKRDFYEILEVSRDADEDTIKKAYRKQAMRYHPDRNNGDKEAEARFREASEAYEVLRDPDKRQRYDRYGHAGLGESIGPPASGESLRNFFNDIFGGMFGHGEASAVADLEHVVEIGLVDAARGGRMRTTIRRSELCPECSGSGARAGTRPQRCQRCRGHGEVVQSNGFFSIRRTCTACQGRGEVVVDKCTSCRGEGRHLVSAEVEVEIPRGVDHGVGVRYQGQGHAGLPGEPRGDLVCVFKVRPHPLHPLLQRKGAHLVCRVPITFAQAALGGQIEIPTLDGSFFHTIERGTQSGMTLHFRGRGVYDLRARQTGDLLAELVIETPKNLTPRQQELFRELAEIEGKHVSPERKSFLEKLRGLFKGESSKEGAR
jgi:molecular chaperone DnaJ